MNGKLFSTLVDEIVAIFGYATFKVAINRKISMDIRDAVNTVTVKHDIAKELFFDKLAYCVRLGTYGENDNIPCIQCYVVIPEAK